jgi:LacI family transcriptional regulator
MKAISEMGLKIPEDIAVAGFGGHMDTSLLPVPLTTVEQPIAGIGQWAVNMLLDQIRKKETLPGPLWLKGKLKIGGSA